VGVDERLERRKGQRIATKGVYRDAVRSTKRKVVTCPGLQLSQQGRHTTPTYFILAVLHRLGYVYKKLKPEE
jgi:hypothetical protein